MVYSPPIIHSTNTNNEPYLGWWLAKKIAPPQTQGWAPSAYLKEEPKAAPPPPPPPPPPVQPPRPANGSLRVGKAAPPPPPAKRPNMTGRGKPPVPGRNITPTTNGAAVAATESSGAGQGGGLAGGLAEALRNRQMAMRGKGEDDDDDW